MLPIDNKNVKGYIYPTNVDGDDYKYDLGGSVEDDGNIVHHIGRVKTPEAGERALRRMFPTAKEISHLPDRPPPEYIASDPWSRDIVWNEGESGDGKWESARQNNSLLLYTAICDEIERKRDYMRLLREWRPTITHLSSYESAVSALEFVLLCMKSFGIVPKDYVHLGKDGQPLGFSVPELQPGFVWSNVESEKDRE